MSDEKSAVIFCPSYDIKKEKIDLIENALYIAVDSGIETAFLFDIVPNVLIGDFDSLKNSMKIDELKRNKKCKIISFPPEKDDTDLMLAIKYALSKCIKYIRIIGGIDGRTDHTLANLFFLMYIDEQGCKGEFTNGFNRIRLLRNGTLKIYKNYKYISIIPLTEKVYDVTLRNMVYPLTDAAIKMSEAYAISNEICEGAEYGEITLKGTALICECEDVDMESVSRASQDNGSNKLNSQKGMTKKTKINDDGKCLQS